MKNLMKLIVLLSIVPALFFTNCKKEEESEFQMLKTYLVDNNMDLDKLLYNEDDQVELLLVVKKDTDINRRFLVDIRAAEDFAAGHIAGAKNYNFSDILTAAADAEAEGKPALIICYTGQTACYATALLRLAGYPKTQALKWGMSRWNSTLDKWTENIGDIAVQNPKWSTGPSADLVDYSDPVLNTGAADGAAILKNRIDAVIAAGYKSVAVADVMAAPKNYFINNFVTKTVFESIGHIINTYNIYPLRFYFDTVHNLDPDATIATCSSAGQQSSFVTAYLNVLGYNAVNIGFGLNAFNNSNSNWKADRWGGTYDKPLSFALVTE